MKITPIQPIYKPNNKLTKKDTYDILKSKKGEMKNAKQARKKNQK